VDTVLFLLGEGMKLRKNGPNLYSGQTFVLILLIIVIEVGFVRADRQAETHPSSVFALSDLNKETRYRFQMPVIDLDQDRIETGNYHYAVVRGRAADTGGALIGQPPQVSLLTVALKGKNKAIASFEVSDPDGDLGKKSGISILLFDKNIKGVASAREGSLLLFGDKSVFPKTLDFTGKTRATFPFTLKGLKQLPGASIWVSGIRDDAGNLSLAPKAAGIAGRAGTGPAPQILNAGASILQNDDVVGLNIDGTDADGDTVGISMAFLDADGEIEFALGIVGDDGLENFTPFPLDLVKNPVRGQMNFNINFSISEISQEVKPGTLKAVAVSLIDSNGNSSPARVVQFSQ
jgi:hypothetical protein